MIEYTCDGLIWIANFIFYFSLFIVIKFWWSILVLQIFVLVRCCRATLQIKLFYIHQACTHMVREERQVHKKIEWCMVQIRVEEVTERPSQGRPCRKYSTLTLWWNQLDCLSETKKAFTRLVSFHQSDRWDRDRRRRNRQITSQIDRRRMKSDQHSTTTC